MHARERAAAVLGAILRSGLGLGILLMLTAVSAYRGGWQPHTEGSGRAARPPRRT